MADKRVTRHPPVRVHCPEHGSARVLNAYVYGHTSLSPCSVHLLECGCVQAMPMWTVLGERFFHRRQQPSADRKSERPFPVDVWSGRFKKAKHYALSINRLTASAIRMMMDRAMEGIE